MYIIKQIQKNFRYALWGILGALGVYAGMIVYNTLHLPGRFDIFFVVTRLFIPGSILLVEMGIYCLIRKRLYDKLWVRLHIISIWIAIIVLPITYLVTFKYITFGDFTDNSGFSRNDLSAIFGIAFILSIAAGHLFFILTIVKSFSKKKRLQTNPDATDSPHILDEFNQQSAGL